MKNGVAMASVVSMWERAMAMSKPMSMGDSLQRPLFEDVGGTMLPQFWNQPGHTGGALQLAFMGPAFVDLDHDGTLDMVNLNHYSTCELTADGSRCKDPWTWDIGFTLVDAKGNTQIAPAPRGFVSITDDMSEDREIFMRVSGGAESAIQANHTVAKPWNADAHGFTVADLDNDGAFDIYATIGVDHGLDKSSASRNIVVWGTNEGGFAGGREKAEEAGIDALFARSRGVTLFDADGDGVLDMYLSHEAREDDLVVPSVFLLSQGGDRHWTVAYGNRQHGEGLWRKGGPLSIYSSKALLVDADGDGLASEMVALALQCEERSLKATAPTKMMSQYALGETPEEFCQHHPPAGSLMVFQLTSAGGAYAHVLQFEPFRGLADAARMASEDVDGDGLADLIVLSRGLVHGFLSTTVKKGELLLTTPLQQLTTWQNDFYPVDFAMADFDLDGVLDLFVVGKEPGEARLMQNDGSGKFKCCLHTVYGTEVDWPMLPAFHPQEAELRLRSNDPLKQIRAASRGLTLVDWNNDGYMDVFLAHAKQPCTMLQNQAAEFVRHPPRYIAIVLEGLVSNKEGIGASAVLYSYVPGTNETATQLRTVGASQRAGGHDERRMIFGMGEFAQFSKVVVTWPSGFRQSVGHGDFRGGEGTSGKPFRIREDASIGVTGAHLETMEKDGSIVDVMQLSLTVSSVPGREDLEPVAFKRIRARLEAKVTDHYDQMLLIESDLPPMDRLQVHEIVHLPIGGIGPGPRLLLDGNEGFSCGDDSRVFPHLRKTGSFYDVRELDGIKLNRMRGNASPYYGSVIVEIPRTTATRAQLYYQVLDPASCMLSRVFTINGVAGAV